MICLWKTSTNQISFSNSQSDSDTGVGQNPHNPGVCDFCLYFGCVPRVRPRSSNRIWAHMESEPQDMAGLNFIPEKQQGDNTGRVYRAHQLHKLSSCSSKHLPDIQCIKPNLLPSLVSFSYSHSSVSNTPEITLRNKASSLFLCPPFFKDSEVLLLITVPMCFSVTPRSELCALCNCSLLLVIPGILVVHLQSDLSKDCQ